MRIKSILKKGFTMMEMVAVIAVLGVVAAIATPMVGTMIDDGNDANRSLIARSIYVSAQNQLTEKRILQSLSDFVTNAGIKNDAHLVYTSEKVTNLNEIVSEGKVDSSNKGDVYFISKAKGETSGPLYDMLYPVIQKKDILRESILIEFNIKTGVVLSVFYSDVIEDGQTLQYMGSSNDIRNVSGKRPYEFSERRNQGYYGAAETNVIVAKNSTPIVINIKDGYNEALNDTQGFSYTNVLYADILIPDTIIQKGMTYTLKLGNKDVITNYDFTDALTSINLSSELPYTEGNIIYKLNGDFEEGYSRFIWVIDYVGGDMLNSSGNIKHSIGTKYPGVVSSATGGNISVELRAEFSEISARSLSYVNPLFVTKDSYLDGIREVGSARHLYNVRYYKSGNFSQIDSIDFSVGTDPITNFIPIGTEGDPFTGSYNGNQNAVRNLVINYPAVDHIGLFGVVQGTLKTVDEYDYASISNLVLHNPSISGGGNSAALVGRSIGLVDSVYISFDKELYIDGTVVVGGIIGRNEGMLTNSVFISNFNKCHIRESVMVSGGLIGYNTGTVEYCMFLAIAPAEGLSEEAAEIHPFVSYDAAITNKYRGLYYLSGKSSMPGAESYNMKPAWPAIGIPVGTKYAYTAGMPANWKKMLKSDGSEYTLDEIESQISSIYPYPFVFDKNLLSSWPIVYNTEKPPQVSRPSIQTSLDSTLRKSNLNFLNGDFERHFLDDELNNISRNRPSHNFIGRDYIPGWQTRPTSGGTPSGYDQIEVQKAGAPGVQGFAETDYKGQTGGWYAELNAHVAGTLYQICNTTPGEQVYYSFYHNSRNGGNNPATRVGNVFQNKMNFYLSPMDLQNGDYQYKNGNVLIRPCWTNRSAISGIDSSRDTINYGGNWNLPYFGLSNVYLYDVWGGDSGKYANIGVTFYSYTAISNPTVNSIIDTNIIGYWDTAFQWKRYYGFYNVPEGQNITEFAYESQTLNAISTGNYLDGITFSTPSHLIVSNTVDKTYVSPNETVRVTLSVKNVGESSAKEVELIDEFGEFTNLFQYAGNLEVKNATKNQVLNSNEYSFSYDNSNSVLKVNLPDLRGIQERNNDGETSADVEGGDTITVSFDLDVRNNVLSNGQVTSYSTVGYYFDNQAVVRYKDKNFDGYAINSEKKTSASPDVRVQISPARFEKTVVEKTKEYNRFDQDGNPIQYFEVTTKYSGVFYDSSGHAMSISGNLIDVLTPGFKMTEDSLRKVIADGGTVHNNWDGSSTLWINLRNMGPNDNYITYVVEYRGKSSGVLPISAECRYEYSAASEVTGEAYINRLYVAEPSVGLNLKTVNVDNLGANVGAVQNLKFLTASKEKYLKNIVNIGDYDIGNYKVILTDENGNPMPVDANGNSFVDTDNYEAKILRDGEGDAVIAFRAKNLLEEPANLYYKIILSAINIKDPSLQINLDSRVTRAVVSTDQVPTEKIITETTERYNEKDENNNTVQHFDVSLSAWYLSSGTSLNATFKDIINKGFEITETSMQRLQEEYSATITKNEDGSATLVIPNYSVTSTKRPVVYTVKYTGNNYGNTRISKSTSFLFDGSKGGETSIPQSDVVIKPKTKDYSVEVVKGQPTVIDDYISKDLIAESNKFSDSGYTIGSYTVSLTNSLGYERQYNLAEYAAVKGINNEITVTVFNEKKSPYDIYYIIKFDVVDSEGKVIQLLTTRPTKITLNVKK